MWRRAAPTITLLVLAATMGMEMSGCQRAPANPEPARKAGPEVVFLLPSGPLRVEVELARSEAERARGLMYRQALEGGHGMLFLFPKSDQLKFWMRNTYLPLDMIFLDEGRRVVHIEENAKPLTDTPRGPDVPSRYVVEVPGGWARAHGIDDGATAQFVGVP